MHTYLVRLADRLDEKASQRILVIKNNPEGMQEFVDTLTDLEIAHPVVVNIHKLAIRRPVRTVLHTAVSTAV
jgi:DNA-directed RNA polymerase beta' subunit